MSDDLLLLLADDVIIMLFLLPVMTVLCSFGILCNSAPLSSHHRSRPHRTDHRSRDANFEDLCETVFNVTHLNTEIYEYYPPIVRKVYCKHLFDRKVRHDGLSKNVQKCGFDLLQCVQQYDKRHFSRRRFGTSCWETYELEIPTGCACMWPSDELGPLRNRDEL